MPKPTREQLSARLAQLLKELDPEDRKDTMSDIETTLRDASLLGWGSIPSQKTPEAFSQDLFRMTAPWLMNTAEEQGYDGTSAESPMDLVLRLMPSDGHLD
jgi:hypothetical protein